MPYLLVFLFFVDGQKVGHVEMQVPTIEVCMTEKSKMEKKYHSRPEKLIAECQKRFPKQPKS